ncbi:putative tail spike protein [Cronobacter phage GW1]|uniref:Putative tail spike protein n=1 Tax=Cronobacter phage GW1 TaxID=2200756 RepID=A0A3S7N8Q7_9CAUD|nr:putative tail spike protein [Cronobacter phage GW1]AWY03148.1 putative tail spike protein [Cronobacter phage GW1]
MSLLKRFDDLMSHLNGEDNSLAEEFREALSEAVEDLQFLDALRAAGVDNWEGYECAQELMEYEDDE